MLTLESYQDDSLVIIIIDDDAHDDAWLCDARVVTFFLNLAMFPIRSNRSEETNIWLQLKQSKPMKFYFKRGMWAVKIDLKKGYFHIPVNEDYIHLLGFIFDNQTYEFIAIRKGYGKGNSKY